MKINFYGNMFHITSQNEKFIFEKNEKCIFCTFSQNDASSTQNTYSMYMVGPKFSLFSKSSSLIIFDYFIKNDLK